MLGRLFRSLLGVALLPLVAAVGSALLAFLKTTAGGWMGSPFMWGAVVFLPLGLVLLFVPPPFVQILEHELGHYILARLLGWDVHALAAVEGKGGGVIYSGGILRPIVTLGPYFLPVFTVPLVIARPFLANPVQAGVDFLIGLTLAWHYFSVVAEVRIGQPDVSDVGPLFWLPFTLLFNAGILVLIVGVIAEDLSAIPGFASDCAELARNTYGVAFRWLESVVERWQ